jgi:hypothetical protein
MTRYFYKILLILPLSFWMSGQAPIAQLKNFADPALFNLKDTSCLNISGEWLGEETEYYDGSGKIKGKYNVKFILQQEGNKVSGNSLISFDNGQSSGNMKIRGMISGSKWYFEEYEVVEQKFTQPGVGWCLRTGELDFKVSGNSAILEGSNYKGYAAFYYFDCKVPVNMSVGKAIAPREAENAKKITAINERCEMQLRPNPAMNEVMVAFKIAEEQIVRIDMFDLSGRLMGNIVNDLFKTGTHQQVFNLGTYPAGVYLIHMQAGNQVATGHLVIAK